MRFLYFIVVTLVILNSLILIIGGLIGENIYKKYGKQIVKVLLQFLLLLITIYVSMLISGLST